VYGIVLPFFKPWTSKPDIINIALELFDATTTSIEASGSEMLSDRISIEARAQLPELASILFACIGERLEWLKWYAPLFSKFWLLSSYDNDL